VLQKEERGSARGGCACLPLRAYSPNGALITSAD
jgi:hypothetical protein